jgi:NTP pyrophosphatase (non-canonical NTP hydrolase)
MSFADRSTTLAELSAAVRRFNEERDWARYHCARNMAMALCTESAELLELYLWSSDEGPQPPVASREPLVAEEAADVLICLLALCDRAGVDLAAAVEAKLVKNAGRYPVERAKGRLEKAGELG